MSFQRIFGRDEFGWGLIFAGARPNLISRSNSIPGLAEARRHF